MNALAFSLLLALAPLAGAGGPPAHDLHVSYGSAVVEGAVLTIRVRFFKNDLQDALARQAGRAAFTLRAEPEVEAAFLAYFRARFSIQAGGRALEPVLVGSGEDELDREPVWWYAIRFEAPAPLASFRVRNTLLGEIFDDQTNIVKFVRLPDERQKTYSFGKGEESFEVRF